MAKNKNTCYATEEHGIKAAAVCPFRVKQLKLPEQQAEYNTGLLIQSFPDNRQSTLHFQDEVILINFQHSRTS